MNVMRARRHTYPPPDVVVKAGAVLDQVVQPFRRLHRTDYLVSSANTSADLVWSKALAGAVADICPAVSPRSMVPKRRSQGLLWACSYISAISRAAEDVVSVYVNTYHLGEFLERVLPDVRKPLVLVLGDSILPVPN